MLKLDPTAVTVKQTVPELDAMRLILDALMDRARRERAAGVEVVPATIA